MTRTYSAWQRLSGLPLGLGRLLFSAGMVARVPYFGTVLPRVVGLRPGYCEVAAPKWWGVHNHLGTFHAIAACNLAEVAMGMLAEATVPATHRWIPRGMTVEYLAPGRSGLRAIAQLPEIPRFDGKVDLPVPVRLVDRGGTTVVTATITVLVSPKK
ncbi:thioesterase [Longimycelium tulufanense]|uniref:Thioesterase n=1 Tax=Longimycelium tulufanense TaxID=907463 RepID=A0A8J3CDM1_9PSEU|nr:hotdog fold domain-containing protein [Longimycelium tulufanense]GGM78872.1 thioesterase [Longimycelium tulufanense]